MYFYKSYQLRSKMSMHYNYACDITVQDLTIILTYFIHYKEK